MISRDQSIANIELCKSESLLSKIQQSIGIGVWDWRGHEWGDGTVRTYIKHDSYSQEQIQAVLQECERNGWQTSFTPNDHRTGEYPGDFEWWDCIRLW